MIGDLGPTSRVRLPQYITHKYTIGTKANRAYAMHSRVFAGAVAEAVRVLSVHGRASPVVVTAHVVAEEVRVDVAVQAVSLRHGEPRGKQAGVRIPDWGRGTTC